MSFELKTLLQQPEHSSCTPAFRFAMHAALPFAARHVHERTLQPHV